VKFHFTDEIKYTPRFADFASSKTREHAPFALVNTLEPAQTRCSIQGTAANLLHEN
jgi:hypothetical protein